jgi:chemotaxis protein methyltransferase CheR
MLPSESLDEAAALVRRKTGLTFAGIRVSALESGLVKAMQAAGISNPSTYVARLDSEVDLLDALVAEITIGETHFFRDREQWELLRTTIFPSLLSQRSTDRPLRVWSAGCATGEEPYTAAIVLHELGAGAVAHIIGTDLSRRSLSAARRGLYTRWSLRGVPPETEEAYFRPAGRRYELAPAIRESVEFRYHNLAADVFPSVGAGLAGMDVVLCRNVLIYFDSATLPAVARRLLDSLSDDGWLLLGASDPPIAGLARCDVQLTGSGLAYRRARESSTVAVPGQPEERAKPVRPASVPPAPRPKSASGKRRDEDVSQAIARVRRLANQGNLPEAARVCTAAMDLHRGSAELAYLHGVLLMESGRAQEAAQAARVALYLDRGLAVGHLLLGGALARVGEIAAARRAVRSALTLLQGMSPDAVVPASDGETAARLSEMARVQLDLMHGAGVET